MTNFKRSTCLPVLALAAGLLLAPSALAQDANQEPSDVVATVNGIEITYQDVEIAREDIGQMLQQLPAPQRELVLVNYLVDMKLIASAVENTAITEDADFQRRLSYYRNRALMQAAVEAEMAEKVTEETMQAFYEDVKGSLVEEGAEEVRASHILVRTEDEAKEIVAELEGGADFAELARKKSIDPAGQNGGDLGYFGRGNMVPSFEEAAFALEIGQVSEPVESRFGWHVIKLEDRREQQPPAFEELRDQIMNVMARQTRNDYVQALRQNAEIIIAGERVPNEPEATEEDAEVEPAPAQ